MEIGWQIVTADGRVVDPHGLRQRFLANRDLVLTVKPYPCGQNDHGQADRPVTERFALVLRQERECLAYFKGKLVSL